MLIRLEKTILKVSQEMVYVMMAMLKRRMIVAPVRRITTVLKTQLFKNAMLLAKIATKN